MLIKRNVNSKEKTNKQRNKGKMDINRQKHKKIGSGNKLHFSSDIKNEKNLLF